MKFQWKNYSKFNIYHTLGLKVTKLPLKNLINWVLSNGTIWVHLNFLKTFNFDFIEFLIDMNVFIYHGELMKLVGNHCDEGWKHNKGGGSLWARKCFFKKNTICIIVGAIFLWFQLVFYKHVKWILVQSLAT
jgi:hypothetical protein